MTNLSEHEVQRRQALQELISLGIEPYPAETFEVNNLSKNILTNYSDSVQDERWKHISIAGRLMSKRIMGSASFAVLQDSEGKIQLYISRDELCPGDDKSLYNAVFKKLLDLGDFIGVTGYVFITKSGEISIHVRTMKLLSKALKPLPFVKEKEGQIYDEVTDPELRYRQRYVDLNINRKSKETFIIRSKLQQTMRIFFVGKRISRSRDAGIATHIWRCCGQAF